MFQEDSTEHETPDLEYEDASIVLSPHDYESRSTTEGSHGWKWIFTHGLDVAFLICTQ